eukprot:PhM_4_TR15662/c5_g1_i1/m.3380
MIFEVVPHLFLGDADVAADFVTIVQRNITHILNVTSEYPCPLSGLMDIKYLQLNISSLEVEDPEGTFLDDANRFIQEALSENNNENNNNVLVHCSQGRSRSPGVVIYYLLKNPQPHAHLSSLKDVIVYLRSSNPIINPSNNMIAMILRRAFPEPVVDNNDEIVADIIFALSLRGGGGGGGDQQTLEAGEKEYVSLVSNVLLGECNGNVAETFLKLKYDAVCKAVNNWASGVVAAPGDNGGDDDDDDDDNQNLLLDPEMSDVSLDGILPADVDCGN